MATIKDTIHRYIELDSLERRVVDSPWFQRLRRVRQNDVSSVVYPTMQATRFEHSLGAMHLAGRCLSAALDPDDSDLPAFLAALRDELKAVVGLPSGNENLRKFAVNVARLYGALHDIGHPPYSHLLESCYTLRDVCGVEDKTYEYKWHEYNGLQIVTKKLSSYLVHPVAENAARLTTVGILNAKKPPGRALFAIKQLVDAVIDADRMDFVARDGRTSGSEFGTYDIDRLVESFRLFNIEAPRKAIFIRPSDKALSAIESLLQERYKIYRWVHYHHRVMQAKALMRYALRKLSREMPGSNFSFEHYVGGPGTPHGWAFLGDGYIDQMLEKHLLALEAAKARQQEEERLLLALQCLLRRNHFALPLWKRKEHYSLAHDSAESFVRAAFEAQPVRPRLRMAEGKYGSLMNWFAAGLSKIPARVEQITSQLEVPDDETGEWFLIEIVGQKTDRDEDALIAGQEKKRIIFLTEISTVAESIAQASLKDVYLFAFRLSPAEVPDVKREELLSNARKRLAARLVDAYYKTPGLAAILDGLLPKGTEEYGNDDGEPTR